MTKPKPPRVLESYDDEWGYIVLGTLDPEEARPILISYLNANGVRYLGFVPVEEVLETLKPPQPVWVRQTFGYEQYKWQIQYTTPGARGASAGVEWANRY